jgi:TPP-dependent pyruvate/acetoin dehydrogenase alpha subunit
MDKKELSEEILIDLYRTMKRIRSFEQEVIRLNSRQLLPGFIHSYIGEEASATGACKSIMPDDFIISNHRGHGHLIAIGCNLKPMMAELFGKVSGYCSGKGGSMHIADFKRGIIGANGIVGGGLPIACGVGLAAKLDNKGRVVLCFFGDGASNQGVFHESLNLASIWNLPIIYICENNLYALGTAQSYHQRVKHISKRASSYGIQGKTVDGNNVLSVLEVVNEQVQRARNNMGPSLIETRTYRWRSHSEADPQYGGSRTKAEVEKWKQKCPIKRFELFLSKKGILNTKKRQEIEKEVEAEVLEAIEFAKSSPYPKAESALDDVYFERSAI